MAPGFDTQSPDPMAMIVSPVEPWSFDRSRYEDWAAAADERFARFLSKSEGVAVWQRVRVAEVFRDGCRDMVQSLRWQLGGLTRALDYLSDAPAYLEPWYGIGTTAAAFGAEYEWLEGQAPAVRPLYSSVDQASEMAARNWDQVPILRHTIRMIEFLFEYSRGRLPMSWSDVQGPLNVVAGLINTTGLFPAFYEKPEMIRQALAAVTEQAIAFTTKQAQLIGSALARPGHGFASSRAGTGIGLSVDDLIMVSPAMYADFCCVFDSRIGEAFGGTAIHSCGNWGRWIPAVKTIPNLIAVDGAFSPETDPAFNECEEFRDAFAGTGVVIQARMVGSADHVIERVKRFRVPGVKLIVGTHVQDPAEQKRLYYAIHELWG